MSKVYLGFQDKLISHYIDYFAGLINILELIVPLSHRLLLLHKGLGLLRLDRRLLLIPLVIPLPW